MPPHTYNPWSIVEGTGIVTSNVPQILPETISAPVNVLSNTQVIPVHSAPLSGHDTFHNNRAPFQEETITLRQILDSKRELLTHLDRMIEQASKSVADLEPSYENIKAMYESSEASYLTGKQFLFSLVRAKESMQPAIDQIRSLLHPIRRYPNDILSLIFIAALKEEQHQERYLISDTTGFVPRYRRRHVALVISQVCRAWRALAHATPELWSTVRLNLARRGSQATSKLAHFAYYAKAVPLNIMIYHPQPSFFPSYPTVESDDENGITPLLDIANNIGVLEIQFSHYRALSLLSRLGTNKLDRLKALSLRSDPIILSTNLEFSLTSYLSFMPDLRRLTLTNLSLNLSLHDLGFTIPTLSHLTVHGAESADANFGERNESCVMLNIHGSQ
jgi:hypothetical protein